MFLHSDLSDDSQPIRWSHKMGRGSEEDAFSAACESCLPGVLLFSVGVGVGVGAQVV